MGILDIFNSKGNNENTYVTKSDEQPHVICEKRTEQVVCLKKEKGIGDLIARVVYVIDDSGSMSGLYRNGEVQETVERIFPVAIAFDDDKQMEMFAFAVNCIPLTQVNQGNYLGYVDKYIVRLNSIDKNGTNYAPVIKKVCNEYNKPIYGANGKIIPTFVIFVTDGDNQDKSQTTYEITEAAKLPIFWQFVGIGHEKFAYLDKLDNLPGRVIDNAGFFKLEDLSKVTDEQLYKLLLKEFPSWINKAREDRLFNI